MRLRRGSTAFPTLQKLCVQPLAAMDVGAAGGMPDQWRAFSDSMDITAFEPDTEECEKQRQRAEANVHWFPVALAGKSGPADFFILTRRTGSSLYPPNENVLGQFAPQSYWSVHEVVELKCQSLQDFLELADRPTPQLLKLDTQGSELDILSSLSAARWPEVLAAEIEVEFLELYRGQPLFPDVHNYMTGRGFQLFDLRTHRAYRASATTDMVNLREKLHIAVGRSSLSAQLVAGDALYVRPPENDIVFASRATLVHYILILAMYRYFDVAFKVLDDPRAARLLSPGEVTEINRDLIRGAPRPRLFDRVGPTLDLARKVRRRFAGKTLGYQAFWTRREWPNQ